MAEQRHDGYNGYCCDICTIEDPSGANWWNFYRDQTCQFCKRDVCDYHQIEMFDIAAAACKLDSEICEPFLIQKGEYRTPWCCKYCAKLFKKQYDSELKSLFKAMVSRQKELLKEWKKLAK